MGKKLKYEEVKDYIESLGYELISKEYLSNNKKLIIVDKDGYYYYCCLANLKLGKSPSKFGNNNPYTIQNIKLWCKLNNKPFELVEGQIYERDSKTFKWKCLKLECGEIFNAIWANIQNNRGCGICDGRQVSISNCLATKNPQLASEWHPTKNGDLTPYDITLNSRKEVWWQCSKNPKHEWHVAIYARNNNGCPYCSGFYASEDYNLLVCNPELCEEWNYDKNDKFPSEYTPNSNKFAWWICKECEHEWNAQINNRNGGSRGCPECNKSRGEKRCKEFFISNNFIEIGQDFYDELINKNDYNYYIPQKTFTGLVGLGNGLLSYDFYLPKYNLLIEYQGEFHDGTAKQQTKEGFEYQKEHDKRKKEYALKNGIQLLEIWYWEFDNIEEVLESLIGGEK